MTKKEGFSIQTNHSVWITANAGSGKTTYLTRRAVALLVQGVPPENICCITYTNAAAGEMRTRILAQLRQLFVMDDSACSARLTELLGRSPTVEEVARARSLFATVLDSQTGGLRLMTIHGFCQHILRSFPLEAGVSPHFTVLEESAAERLIAREKQRLLKSYQGGDAALDAALGLIAERMSEGRFDDVIGAIITRRSAWEALWRHQTPAVLRARLYALHGLDEEVDEASLLSVLSNMPSDADAAVLREYLPALQQDKNQASQKTGAALVAWLEAAPNERAAHVEQLCSVFLIGDGSLRKSLYGKNQFAPDAPIHTICQQLGQHVLRFQQQRAALACAEESYAVAVVARALLTQYERAKAALYALDYDDLIAKTQELLANTAMLGWVMTKLDHRIDHLMVDEAQDTSSAQWAMTRVLVEELIAADAGGLAHGLPRTLLVVGDEKQSIYSFQGAAPELFASTKREFEAMLDGSGAPLASESLTYSYRSAEAVLRLVDEVAKLPEVAPALSAAGKAEPHVQKRLTATGKVVLHPLVQTPKPQGTPALTMPVTYDIQQRSGQQLAEQVAETVAGWIGQKRLIEGTQRVITAGDILVLVRTRGSVVLPLIRALERRNVAVAGLDRLTLSEHLAVRDALALMRWVLNPVDDLALAHVLSSPLIGMDGDALRALCVGRAGTVWRAMDAQPVLLQEALKQAHSAPYEFLSWLLEVQDTRRLFAERFGDEVHEILDELKQQALAMPEGTAATLANFHDWMTGSRRQIKREQETGDAPKAVRIMTVHGAKGLEAPVVLMVDTVSVPTTQKEIFYFMADAQGKNLPLLSISDEAKQAERLAQAKERKAAALLAEYYRLLYVALTRARDELHLFGVVREGASPSPQSWYAVVEQALNALTAVEEEQGKVLYGVRQQEAAEAPASEAAAHVLAPVLPEWVHQAPPPAVKRKMRLTPSQLVTADAVAVSAQVRGGDARSRGVILHRMLELVTLDSDRDTLMRLASRLAPEWDEAARAKAVDEVYRLRERERWIWECPSHAEAMVAGTVTMSVQDVAIGGQIDRLVETPDAWVILDYKTGNHVPASEAEIPLSYLLQMKTYQALLSGMYRGKPVRTAILWTARAELMWCDTAVAATDWPDMREFVRENA